MQDVGWQKSMKEETLVIEKNSKWELVDRPIDKDVIGVKWINKTKFNLDGSFQKKRARLVEKSYSQKPEVDFNETFTPLARLKNYSDPKGIGATRHIKLKNYFSSC